ncbi:MAG: hypothetical protein GX329_05760 [Tissierellia bacterium]|nr:hypothetical protein [Tissierellia bacterium]
MSLYKLKMVDDDIEEGILERVLPGQIDYEKDFENWLENSPNILLDEEEGKTILWIGRQVTASIGEVGKYPDLIGVDGEGDLVIVELKKSRTPRDVIAQILEYAAWGYRLKYEDLNDMAQLYYNEDEKWSGKSLNEIFRDTFYPDDGEGINFIFNRAQKLYIIAEDISPSVKQVATYLRNIHDMDIFCMEYKVLKTQQGEFFISTEKVVGHDDIIKASIDGKGTGSIIRWSGDTRVKDIVSDYINRITGGDRDIIFTQSEVINGLVQEHPAIKPNTIRCQIIQDCVNHTSRKHYPSGQRDLFFRIGKGKFRLYDPKKDGKWDWRGKRITG